ncbi:hypothetical protein FA15DRAFT_710669, partial [Coprinopsis marcescibilis]
MPSLDASSKESLKDYDSVLTNLTTLFNQSPSGQRHSSGLLRVVDILVKLTGMHTDHCNKEKKDAEALKALKEEACTQVAGEEEMLEQTTEELFPYFLDGHEEMMKKAGGKGAWDRLTP